MEPKVIQRLMFIRIDVNVNVNEQFLSPLESCNIVTMAAP